MLLILIRTCRECNLIMYIRHKVFGSVRFLSRSLGRSDLRLQSYSSRDMAPCPFFAGSTQITNPAFFSWSHNLMFGPFSLINKSTRKIFGGSFGYYRPHIDLMGHLFR